MKFRNAGIGKANQFAEFVQKVLAARQAQLSRKIEIQLPIVQLPKTPRLGSRTRKNQSFYFLFPARADPAKNKMIGLPAQDTSHYRLYDDIPYSSQ